MNDIYLKEQEDFNKIAAKIIYEHKDEFDSYIRDNLKLLFIKTLKEYTGGGLKECKTASELYIDGNLKPYIKEERQKKLERLAKKPLIENIILNIRQYDDDSLRLFLTNLSTEELLNIDGLFDVDIKI